MVAHGVRQKVRGGVLAVQVRSEVRAHAMARARGAVRPVDAARKAGLKQENVERRGERGGGGAPHRRPPGAPRAERWREGSNDRGPVRATTTEAERRSAVVG